ncbi:SDR family oxidoreductase [Fulvimarina endophytica]|uniref:SDR family oxidoreductase n=1 Tax=Fulvimarina endophytica TaxID=2293836 RepID=A0A371XBH2_9HYPH|nr:SDR family oxidoreductase [Fulvimarina endophytica]RFC66576.1 SDR family oxidoreductase [Fulvimarina endophytica]
MTFDLTGKTALVTGASGGLGAHFAAVLAEAGASVTLAARRGDVLCERVEAITGAGGRADAIDLDVQDAESVAACFADRVFDITVNNAGVQSTTPALDLDPAEWDHVLDTNLKGAFLVAQAAARALRRIERSGSIVNIASILGLRVAGMLMPYAVSKAGLVQMTKSMALEWARYGIRVNALCPGYIETPLNRDFFATDAGKALVKRIPQRRLGQESDLDGALLLLASDAGRYMTGSELVIDGGHLVSSL